MKKIHSASSPVRVLWMGIVLVVGAQAYLSSNRILVRPTSLLSSQSGQVLQLGDDQQPKTIGKLVFLVPENANSILTKFGTSSPVPNPSLLEAVTHIAQKTNYFCDGLLDFEIVSTTEARDASSFCDSELFIAMGLSEANDIAYAQAIFQARRNVENTAVRHRLCHFALESAAATTSATLPAMVGPYDATRPSWIAKLVPWTTEATAMRMHAQMLDLFARWTTDDFCCALVLFLNQFSGSPVEWVRYRTDASWEKGPRRNLQELYAMLTQCRDCVVPAVRDPSTRACLAQLTQIDPRDQATSYRTLVSYESELLTRFSLCIFTKHNIFQCYATIPRIPVVPPLSRWRGQTLTSDTARALLVGHLQGEAATTTSVELSADQELLAVSWKVACGANVAYDQFPCQNQLFYPANSRDLWYDPVFRVETLDGRHVWCHRHYKVRPQAIPGTFRFSVSDNGVTSDEFWTIVGAADDGSWIVFHYAGAAKTVGLRYLGGLLCTPNGSFPPAAALPEIWDCFRAAGIQPWELYRVDNRLDTPGAIAAGPPPLDVYRGPILEKRRAAVATAAVVNE